MPGSVGIRKFRDRLTHHLGQVRRGDRIVITDRGRPIALLVPYPQGAEPQREERLRSILSGGHVTPAEKEFSSRLRLLKGKGQLPSVLIREGRR